MIVGFDYWQVLSHYPEQVNHMMEMHSIIGDTIHIVSAVGHDREGTVNQAVREITKWGTVHEVVFDHPRQSPELKLAKCIELGITVFYDDRDDVCRLLNKNGIMALRVTRKDNSTYDLGAEQHATNS